MPNSKYINLLTALVCTASGIIFSILVYKFWPHTVDDSFIGYRYGANLAAGHGLVFNADGPRAEGYTTFLWVLVMAIPHLFGLDAVVFSKIAGIILTIGYLCISFHFVWLLTGFLENSVRGAVASIVILSLSAFPPIAVHAVSGMETALFTFLLTLFFYLLTFLPENVTIMRSALLFLTGLLVGLTRPEGNLVVVFGLMATFFRISKKDRTNYIRNAFMFYVIPGGMYFAWRYLYFGLLFPLPFYVKVTLYEKFRVTLYDKFPGLQDVQNFFQKFGIYLSILSIPVIVRQWRQLLPSYGGVYLFLLFYIFPAHLMGYSIRFLFPVIPLMFSFATISIGWVLQWILSFGKPFGGMRHKLMPYLASLVYAAIAILVPSLLLADIRSDIKAKIDYSNGMNNAHIPLGKWMKGFRTNDRTPIVAIGDAGAVPYYSDWKTIDSFGLNEPHIAITGDHTPQYVLASKPDLVVLISSDQYIFRPHLTWENDLYYACLNRGMVHLDTAVFDKGGYFLWIIGDPKSQIGVALQQAK